ncbi:MAG: DUF456 domain-containing protein [Xanthomonadaceae bacterium]|nr:DUF456 domain-containing protein [Xanthomonadaceae bacterium]
MQNTALFYVLAVLMVVVGIIGTVLPALPGVPLVFAGLFLAAWADGFDKVGWAPLLVLGLLTALSLVVDFWATAKGAKRVGASRMAVIGAMLGMFAGLLMGPFGIFIGAFAGAVAGELLHRRSLGQDDIGAAAKIGLGTWLGIVLGMALKLALVFTMVGIFALAWFF